MQKKVIIFCSVVVICFLSGFFIGRFGDNRGAENIDSGITEIESGIDNSSVAISDITRITEDQSKRIAELERLNQSIGIELTEANRIINDLQGKELGANDLIRDSKQGIEESIDFTGSIEERLLRLVEALEYVEDDSSE